MPPFSAKLECGPVFESKSRVSKSNITKGVPALSKPKYTSIIVGEKCYLAVFHSDGYHEQHRISRRVAALLIANKFPYGN